MAGTLIVAVRKSLIDGLAALAAFTTPSDDDLYPACSVSWPLGAKSAEMVYTESATFAHEPASLRAGRTHRHETGRFVAVVRIEGIGKSQEDTSERAVELGTALEEYVADHRIGLGVDGLNWIVMDGSGALEERFNERGSLALLSYPIKYDARLE